MEIKKCIEIGLLCVELNKEDRPTMEDVLGMLNGVKELPALKQPWGIKQPFVCLCCPQRRTCASGDVA
jgi:L1 cell adhesion molecule like protein